MSSLRALPRVEIRSRAQWRRWLAKNHGLSGSIWLVTFKKSAGSTHVPYADVVEEALCFGWIDSRPAKLDEQRSMLLLSPRKPGSPWSKLNKQRVGRLSKARLMTPAGEAAVERAKADGSWTIYDQAETLEEPADLAEALATSQKALNSWRSFSPSARRGILWWIISAKRSQTRAKRVAETVRLAKLGIKANHPEARGK